ncbi:N-acetylmuramic acid 6-phosphate etherase [Paenibacillus nasutitermitis]|uniref:N-acetylmuramic acid 6-phosphate etherase n=1 Tax=Paenibacillus nasutitermitis TaxID=1652958 RepID=A0A917DUH1_9BACL|nr:N-acetylmuramic acid 6-phosphate etherase [Paenibacillus nasutitermitis]GGD72192.1 N-acetylmuramic acid 6-phosphate etherase [Paenibacillus nasutitermitis]
MNEYIDFLTTEQRNPASSRIDQLSTEQILRLINDEDSRIAEKVRASIPQITAAADLIIEAFRRGGRLFYFGAGTSGRLGILDASECPPTYGTDKDMVQGIIAGGAQAIQEAVEGAEDDTELGASDVDGRGVTPLDVVVGLAASGRTPYVLGAMKRARDIGASVIGISNNDGTPMGPFAHVMIETVVGPEVILGSTRMKAGTAQKLILNMLTTTSMIRTGKVYDNLMVDLNPSNEKLILRSKRIIRMATAASDEEIEAAFKSSDNQVKTAIVMIKTGSGADEARRFLSKGDGFVKQAINLWEEEQKAEG